MGVGRKASSRQRGDRRASPSASRPRSAEQPAVAGVNEYRTATWFFAWMPNLELWYAHIDVEQRLPELKAEVPPPLGRSYWTRRLAKMKTRDSMQAFTKLTEMVDGEPRILSEPPLIAPLRELVDDPEPARGTPEGDRRDPPLLPQYPGDGSRHLLEDFRFVEVRRKVVGVGSVGTRAWIGLMLGRDDSDPFFVPQAKEAEDSVLERYAGKEPLLESRTTSRRRSAPDAGHQRHLPGWDRVTGIDGRKASSTSGSSVTGRAPSRSSPASKGLAMRASVDGRWLGRSGIIWRSDRDRRGQWQLPDGIEEAIAGFSIAYADQNERDYQAMQEAVETRQTRRGDGP